MFSLLLIASNPAPDTDTTTPLNLPSIETLDLATITSPVNFGNAPVTCAETARLHMTLPFPSNKPQ